MRFIRCLIRSRESVVRNFRTTAADGKEFALGYGVVVASRQCEAPRVSKPARTAYAVLVTSLFYKLANSRPRASGGTPKILIRANNPNSISFFKVHSSLERRCSSRTVSQSIQRVGVGNSCLISVYFCTYAVGDDFVIIQFAVYNVVKEFLAG